MYFLLSITDNAQTKDMLDMLTELEVMKSLEPHPHVVKLIGCCTATGTGDIFIRASSLCSVLIFFLFV